MSLNLCAQTEPDPGLIERAVDWPRSNAYSMDHPTGPCWAAQVSNAVVDALLRVADCSIMTDIVSVNINTRAIMIGENASDLILSGHVWSPGLMLWVKVPKQA